MVLGFIGGLAGRGASSAAGFLKKYGAYLLLLVGGPLLFIWSVNYLLGLGLPYDFSTWFAVVVFLGVPLIAVAVVRKLFL